MIGLNPAALGMALSLALASAASAAEPPKGLSIVQMEGNVGSHRVGASVTVRDSMQPVAGHYFYARKPVDIPLTAKVEGEAVTLEEPGGGVFQLHFVTNESTKERPLNFYISTGLDGTWEKAGERLPVHLFYTVVHNSEPQGRRYGDITDEPDAAFEARVQRFVRGALQGDRAAVASATSYPLRVRGTHALTLRNRAQLQAHWKEVFTPQLLAKLREAVPHEMFVHDSMAMVSNGVVWFDAKGAASINAP